MTDNLELWHSVEKTDPAHVKPITGKSYTGTSPKPQWLIMRATETFGPCGIGWGFSIDERFEEGAMIEPGFHEKMHIAKVKVWYKWKGERGEVEHIGGTVFSGRRSSGKPFTDEDCAKKSVTDALVKALSMIGFAGDIFMGRYDDSAYVADVRREFKEAAQPPRDMTTLLEATEKSLEAAAREGMSALQTVWRGLDDDAREAFGGRAPQRFKDIATAADQQRKAA